MKRTISALIVLFGALAMGLGVLVAFGCSSKGKGGGALIEAPHSVPELTAGLHNAENRLGLPYKGEGIKVSFKVGKVKYKDGWWGETKTIDGVTSVLGGYTYRGNYITLYTDPKTGKPHPFTIEHEMMRAILYSHGYRTEAEMDPIMRKTGWRW
jgi:hypothetical protein